MDYLAKLFDTSDFPARWHCGTWTPAHGWLHVVSDLGVWSAYVTIPFILGYFVLQRQGIPFRKILFLFAAFILPCGTTQIARHCAQRPIDDSAAPIRDAAGQCRGVVLAIWSNRWIRPHDNTC